MNPETNESDFYLMNQMEDIHDQVLERLSRLERAAIFGDLEEFKYQFKKQQAEAYYENME